MIIGTPKEIKDNEYRVGITPRGVRQLAQAGHQVLVETDAGEGSGFSDEEYETSGVKIVSTSAEAWSAQIMELFIIVYPIFRALFREQARMLSATQPCHMF